jgi:hypothetical protein
MRHTGKWCEVFHDLDLDECLEIVEGNELFWPVHCIEGGVTLRPVTVGSAGKSVSLNLI